MDVTYSDIIFYLREYLIRYPLLFPLGIIGIWRWTVWIIKEIIGLNYRAQMGDYEVSISVVTPVYNEDPNIFQAALNSWKKNRPDEIIAVIDYTDERCISIFKKFTKTYKNTKLIITRVPGKRPALALGIKRAKNEIVALVDSDTIWAEDVIKNALPPFHDPKVAGVGTYQSVLNPKTFAQKIFDIQLDLRYRVEYPFLAASGDALICLSGRTAFYKRSVIVPMLPDLVNETFLGKPVISGDDKRLTYLVLAAGWKVRYQSSSHVYTPGMKDLKSYLAQRLRWSRNALRADIRAVLEGWPTRHPALLFFQIDKFFQSIVVILSPIYFFVSLFSGLWVIAAIIFVWWFVSRTIKMYPHLSRRPEDITLVPGFVLYSFLTGFVKIYAFFTLNTQGWITRWDKSRLPQLRFLNNLPGYLGTAATVLVLTLGVYVYKQHTYFVPRQKEASLLSSALTSASTLARAGSPSVLGAATNNEKKLLTGRYVVKNFESLYSVANFFKIDPARLLDTNIQKIPNWFSISPGTVISIPGEDANIERSTTFRYRSITSSPLVILYDQPSNTIVVKGRGKIINLNDIRKSLGDKYIEELAPKEWYLKASIFASAGVTLVLDKKEVEWLKLESNSRRFVILRSQNGDIQINGVKITSWDAYKKDYDRDMTDGRSFIVAKNLGRMDIYNSELAYLGYPVTPAHTVSPYGVSWKLSNVNLKKALLTGEVLNSKFHHNYFGAYTFGATGMVWKGNEFYENVRYGLDPHDDSNGFLVENNKFHSNGSHGLIFSKRCINNTIRNNLSYNNKLHGIMLHELSNSNLIENNTLYGNIDGVALDHSSNNTIRANRIYENNRGIRANKKSVENIIEKNIITKNSQYGVYLYKEGDKNIIRNNTFTKNTNAVYLKSNKNEVTNNIIKDSQVGIYFLGKASQNRVEGNEVQNSRLYGVYSKIAEGFTNFLATNNIIKKNKKDVYVFNVD